MKKELPLLHIATRAEWRAWLATHHASSTGIWLVSFKKHTGKPRLDYGEAVEEALCFGWIDSLVKRVDEERAAQMFTPRKPGSGWSPSNVARFARLVAAGLMTPAGLVHKPTARTKLPPVDNKAAGDLARIPRSIAAKIRRNAVAWKNFQAMTAAQRGMYVRWVTDAKKDETRDRRITALVARLIRNEKPGLK